MIAATFLAIAFVPLFFVIIERVTSWRRVKKPAEAEAEAHP